MIDKWLKAGVLKDGLLRLATEGTSQGGVISPMFSNIYLHHVLDRWFEDEARPRLKGSATLVRYADDFVMTFETHHDAGRVLEVLGKRLEHYGLTLHPDKTRFIDFRPQRRGGTQPGCKVVPGQPPSAAALAGCTSVCEACWTSGLLRPHGEHSAGESVSTAGHQALAGMAGTANAGQAVLGGKDGNILACPAAATDLGHSPSKTGVNALKPEIGSSCAQVRRARLACSSRPARGCGIWVGPTSRLLTTRPGGTASASN